jgi:hypothetical protein
MHRPLKPHAQFCEQLVSYLVAVGHTPFCQATEEPRGPRSRSVVGTCRSGHTASAPPPYPSARVVDRGRILFDGRGTSA